MKLSWVLPACIATAAGLSTGGAFAQGQQPETPTYTTPVSPPVDPNYGLPTYGMQGSDGPQEKTMAPEKEVPPPPDFFSGSTEITLPKPKAPTPNTDTPLYTTSEGSTAGDTSSTTGDMTTSSSDTTTSEVPAPR